MSSINFGRKPVFNYRRSLNSQSQIPLNLEQCLPFIEGHVVTLNDEEFYLDENYSVPDLKKGKKKGT
jgi:hypothetical protein